MIGDKARGVIANARNMTWPMRMIVDITGSPLIFMSSPDTNPNLIATFGTYHLVYNTTTRNGNENVKRFAIVFDFGRRFLKCSNFQELERQAVTNDLARFFLKYTNLCDEMFEIACQNEGMHIPVTFDVVKYNRDIREKLGVENGHNYEMIFNPFKPKWNSRWDVDENNNIYYKELEPGEGYGGKA